MSMSGTPTEFLKLGILEPTDTLNTLVDLNGQWRKVDTGVKDVNTKADTNASNISSLNTQVHDNTENITNILDTNVNQQDDIDLLKTKVQTLETHDGDYETRITNNTNGVQENSELINDLEEDVSGIHLSIGTVPEGKTVEGQISGIDTRVTALENSGSVEALETRVGKVEDSLGTVPSGSTVQGQINDIVSDVGSVPSGSTLQGQINDIVSDVGSVPSGSTLQGQIDSIDSQLTGTLSGDDVPFRFSIDGEGNYGYLKADDSFVPFRSGSTLTPYPNNLTLTDLYYNTIVITNKPYATLKNSSGTHYFYDITNNSVVENNRELRNGSRFISASGGGFTDLINNTNYYYAQNKIVVINGSDVNELTFNGSTTITRKHNGNTQTLTTSDSSSVSQIFNIETNQDGSSITLFFSPSSTTTHSYTIKGLSSTSASINNETTSSSSTVVGETFYNPSYYLKNRPVCMAMKDSNTYGDLFRIDASNKRSNCSFYVVDVTPSQHFYVLCRDGYLVV